MPLSTFSSEAAEAVAPARARQSMSAKQGIIVLLAGLVVILGGLEISSPFILRHLSRTERRINSEMRAALVLRPISVDGKPTVVLAGNSLLIEGVQIDSLRADVNQQFEVSRLTVEQTHYLDWYFGLRRLLQSGSRPSVIVLTLATDQLASRLTMGEAFAYRQMSARDFPLVVREANLDRNTATAFLFAHWSQWQGQKGFIRQCVTILLVPHFRELAGRIADHGPHVDDPAVILARARARMPELAEVARTYGVRIVLLVPPTLHEDHSREIQQIGEQSGVPVWVLSPPGEFPREYFRDGFHLNATGAEIFTSRLAQQLQSMQTLQAKCDHCSRVLNGKSVENK
jgi:lysophospholipase L1-like esterase